MTLTEFLLARIAEDEEWAKAANDGTRWRVDDSLNGSVSSALDLIVEDTRGAPPSSALFHIARHHPIRVLAECEAKRRIVELHGVEDPSDCTPWGRRPTGEPCDTLMALAFPYADHPDYDETWRP